MSAPDSTSSAPPMIKMAGVNKHFGDLHVLRDIDLEVERGQVVVVAGPSGSGKSTLCRTVNRLEPIDAGTIEIDGRPLPAEGQALARLRADVGMVFQQFNLFPHLDAIGNVTLALRKVYKMSKDDARTKGLEVLARVGLQDRAHHYPSQLSGGQQQRVAIARALAVDPHIIFFDEATSALDPELVGEVTNVMRGLAQDGMTMVVVTHEMGFARRTADRVVYMADGVIIEQGTPDEMFGNAQHPKTIQFLSKVTEL
jgi:ABC-type polar amino acid transport system ATPase subunit